MLKKVNNKVFFVVLIVAMALLSTVCLCALQWSYLAECTYGFEETRIGIFREKGVTCLGTTMVDGNNYAGVTVFLKTLDEDGDWVTVTAWEDKDSEFAAVDVDYKVDPGEYKLFISHKAYLPSDLETPVEIHYTETESITIN